MNEYVIDTHTLYWYLMAAPQLGTKARDILLGAEQGRSLIYMPTIVLAELYYMNKKYGTQLDFKSVLANLQHSAQFLFLPFTPEDTLDFETDNAVPEMHDRIIVGVARRLNLPCLTRDQSIIDSGLVATIW